MLPVAVFTRSYTSSPAAAPEYEDTYGTELTDGIRSEIVDGNYSDVALSGYSSSVQIVVDLGAVNDKIYGFKVGYLCYDQAAIAEPGSLSVFVSIDGKGL